MVNVTVSVPDDLKRRMDAMDTVNWSAVARRSFEKHLSDMEFIREFTKESELTEEDAIRLGREIKRRARKSSGKGLAVH